MSKQKSKTKTTSLKESKTALASYRQVADEPVPHLGLDEVRAIINAMDAVSRPKFVERNKLLIQTLFDGCMRVSEAIAIRPVDFIQTRYGWQVRIEGKGDKYSSIAISSSLAAQLQAYCYRHKVESHDRIFPINASRVFQIIKRAMNEARIAKPDHVGSVHILRHSGALERLRVTGNPRAVQDQLRHKSAVMTLRYLKTLSHEESLQIQGSVDFHW